MSTFTDILASFTSSDPQPVRLHWVSADELVTISMGEYPSEQAALDAVPGILGWCASDESRAYMQNGTWKVLAK